MTEGKMYPINLEYFEYLGWARLVLYWTSDGVTYSLVPLRHLFSD